MFFRNFEINKQKISHYLCKTYLEQTLKRKFANSCCKKIYEHLYIILYYCRVNSNYKNNIKQAINVASNKKKHNYIKQE